MRSRTKFLLVLAAVIFVASLVAYAYHRYEYTRFEEAAVSTQVQALRVTNVSYASPEEPGDTAILAFQMDFKVNNPSAYLLNVNFYDLQPLFETAQLEWVMPMEPVTFELMPNSTAIVNASGNYTTSQGNGLYIYSYLSNMTGNWIPLGAMGVTAETGAVFWNGNFLAIKILNPDSHAWQNSS